MFNKTHPYRPLGQNAEARNAQSSREDVLSHLATQERSKNRKGEHRVYAWPQLAKYASELRKGQLLNL